MSEFKFEIGTLADVKNLFPHYKRKNSISEAFSRGRFKPGIKLQKGLFNIGLIKKMLENGETPFVEKQKK
jgi:hypothetical protein